MKLDFKDLPFKETKELPFSLKSFDEETGIFEGYASVFGNVDDGGDRMLKGAFTKTLREDLDRIKTCYQHDPYDPIGKPLEMREDDIGLYVKGKISDTSTGKDVKILLKDKVINELSIGYNVVDKEFNNGVRDLKVVKLFEFSPVTWGMNNMAKITAVKSLKDRLETDEKDLVGNMEIQEIRHERWDIESAFNEVIYDLLEDDEMSNEDKISEFQTSLEQYSTLMTEWFNQMLSLEKSELIDIQTKAGKVLSAKNRKKVKVAADALMGLLEATDDSNSIDDDIDDKDKQKDDEKDLEEKESLEVIEEIKNLLNKESE